LLISELLKGVLEIMIQRKLLKLAVVGLTAGLFISAQSAQTNNAAGNKEVPQANKEATVDTVQKTDASANQKEVAFLKKTPLPVSETPKVSEATKVDVQENDSAKAVCTSTDKCGSEQAKTKDAASSEKKATGCSKCEASSKSNVKGAAKAAVEG
jgi:hypothetical protein